MFFPSGQVPSFCRHVPEGDDQSRCVQTDHAGFYKVGVLSWSFDAFFREVFLESSCWSIVIPLVCDVSSFICCFFNFLSFLMIDSKLVTNVRLLQGLSFGLSRIPLSRRGGKIAWRSRGAFASGASGTSKPDKLFWVMLYYSKREEFKACLLFADINKSRRMIQW